MSNYRGSCPAKDITRTELWTDQVAVLKNTDKPVMFLASGEGRDAETLSTLGVSNKRQVAVDRDKHALAAFKRKHPGCDSRLGNVYNILKGEKDAAYAAIYLDFCSMFCLPNILPLVEARRTTMVGGFFSINLMCARESRLPDGWKDSLPRHPQERGFYGQPNEVVKRFEGQPRHLPRLRMIEGAFSLWNMQDKPSKLCGVYEYNNESNVPYTAFLFKAVPKSNKNKAVIIPDDYKHFVGEA